MPETRFSLPRNNRNDARSRARTLITLALALVIALTASPGPRTAAAATAPPPFLPTAQIDGVVRASDTTGDTAWLGGKFTSTRPAGARPGMSESRRANVMGVSLSTGKATPWAPIVNGAVNSVKATRDGRTVYIAGEFTTVNGQRRERVAAFSTATGALLPFRAVVDGPVLDVEPSPVTDRVYLAGWFTRINGAARDGVGAVGASYGGAGIYAWAPKVTGTVMSIGASYDGSTVLIGGNMTGTAGARPGNGVAVVDPASGVGRPAQVNQVLGLRNDVNVRSIQTTGYGYYFTSWSNSPGYQPGSTTTRRVRYESVTRLTTAGTVVWQLPARGDMYDVWARGPYVMMAGHPHDMSNVGGPGEQAGTYYRATAATVELATKKITGWPANITPGWANFPGYSRPWLKGWYPALEMGTATGQNQAAWTVTGNSTGSIVLYAGEFPTVNGQPQQGIVRLAAPSTAPNQRASGYGSVFHSAA